MDPRDRDLAIRTIIGEAANQPFAGQQAVGNVILNRVNSGRYGGSISDVVFAKNQFEPWMTRRNELMAITPDSPAYARAAQAFDAANSSDVTNGATHFLQPETVRQRRGGSLPSWAQGPALTIGAHAFFKPDNPIGHGIQPSGGAPQQMAVWPPPSGSMAASTAVPSNGALSSTDIVQLAAAPSGDTTPAPLTLPAIQPQSAPRPDEGVDNVLMDPAFEPRALRQKRTRQLSRIV